MGNCGDALELCALTGSGRTLCEQRVLGRRGGAAGSCKPSGSTDISRIPVRQKRTDSIRIGFYLRLLDNRMVRTKASYKADATNYLT